ncbi:MAG TPA: TSUP family transporter, partial [Bacteroidia bacterium]|nr:TSUP family transporter [Bacteroidia bacterium]
VIGAELITHFDKEMVRPVILGLLVVVAIYTYFKKDFGIVTKEGVQGPMIIVWSLITGAVLGLYDGFFGPGTGSFLIVIYISLFGFDFLNASVSAKLINCATNVAALAAFIWSGNIVWEIAIPLAVFNMTGSWLGVKTALKRGRGFIRVFFLVVMSAMILKFAWDLFVANQE